MAQYSILSLVTHKSHLNDCLMVFCLKILGGCGDLWIIILLKKINAASVVVTCKVVGTLNHYKMVKKMFEMCTLRM